MATDLDLQVVESLDAVSVESAGAITVSAHLLFDIARKLPDGSQVSLETADNRMTVKAGRSRFQLPTLPRDDFPVIVEGDLPTSFELPGQDAGRTDRPHALRHLDRGNALLPQRHLPARLRRGRAGAQGGGDRRPPPRALHPAAPRRRRGHARRDRAAQRPWPNCASCSKRRSTAMSRSTFRRARSASRSAARAAWC